MNAIANNNILLVNFTLENSLNKDDNSDRRSIYINNLINCAYTNWRIMTNNRKVIRLSIY